MPLVVVLVLIAVAIALWLSSQHSASLNEKLYLRRRGYDVGQEESPGPPVSRETRLFSLIQSLEDLSPNSRQRAAEDLGKLCESGLADRRMYAPLVTALEDSNAPVRAAVAGALGSLGDQRAISPLERLSQNDDSIHVRAAARRALEKLIRPSFKAKD